MDLSDSSDNDSSEFHTLEEFDAYLKKTLQSEGITTSSEAVLQTSEVKWSLEICNETQCHGCDSKNPYISYIDGNDLNSDSAGCPPAVAPLNAMKMKKTCAPYTANRQTSKLTLGEKLEIIRQYENSDNKHKTHTQFAKSYGKSRSAISKLLKPENIMKLKVMAATGVQPTVKRSVLQVPDFERAVREFVLKIEGQTLRRSKVQAFASDLARRMGMLNFSAGRGWYNGFMRRYGLSKRQKA
ncbi:hypothetical protein GUITHDRAFT_134781 [Guillardia theta CCMP2712]|uniref:HTH CENPB-type domain-containing protein n=1 Tax=Guillardia theta (strain CCMP2712) TaxID=905079 RepID=L1JTB2_GUITC|nr:hypothetical protein GUITHDRAFT_134781 [Guillardia theta CCMP2712]EKX51303.1 hypothetical protein GUITHDRAFT_134781 [Guillardia theta CCMP2712]|eukprot:XP_005838283.1 hypothetical protein GUITHDRAFT_134781 [Guillardia theta CCMP2712]